MTGHNSTASPAEAQEPKVFLIGTVQDNEKWVRCCPHSGTLVRREEIGSPWEIFSLPCKRWGCRWCGPKRSFHFALRIEAAKPTKFITLTVDPKHWLNPQIAYDKTRRKLADFAKLLRKKLGAFEYFRVLEATKAGWPHYHLLARCKYIPQKELSRIWAELTGAVIVDVRAVDKGTNVFKYVLKYLCKQQHIPWTDRRVSWTRSFFPNAEKPPKDQRKFHNWTRKADHPAAVITERFCGQIAREVKPGIWMIDYPLPT